MGLMTTKLFNCSQPHQGLTLHQAPWSLLSAVLKWSVVPKSAHFSFSLGVGPLQNFPSLQKIFLSLRCPVAIILNTNGVCQSQIIPVGFVGSQKKKQMEYFGCFRLISPHSDNLTLSGCLFCLHTTVHLSRILGDMETLGRVKRGCAEMWALSFVPPKG